jgi:subtilisin family serine protease
MNEENRFKIISEDYADLLFEYDRNMDLLERRSDISFNLINEKYAIQHIPISYMNENSVNQFGYWAIPKCFGLMTLYQNNTTEGFTVRHLPTGEQTGKGVLVGIVDTGIDYTHPTFKYSDSTSKIISIWDQTIESGNYPNNFFYGTEYSREQINNALQAENPFDIVPSIDTTGEGTAMAGISGGNFVENFNYSGVAMDAELVIVKLKPAKIYLKDFYGIPRDTLCFQENDILMGINYLYTVSKKLQRPIVICLGTATSQGSHKGENIMSNYLSELDELIGNAIVVPAGNEGNQSHHYHREIIPPDYYDIVELNVGPKDKNFTMEVWGYPPNVLAVDVYSPNNELIVRVTKLIVGNSSQTAIYKETTIYIDNVMSETYSEQQLILFRFKNAEKGTWKFQVSGTKDLVTVFHFWLPIRNFISDETYFLKPDFNTTICTAGNTLKVLTSTSYNPVNRELDLNSSRGFNTLGEPKPDIAAPGVNILAPNLSNSFNTISGTSISAAHTAGIVAGFLEWGIVNGYYPYINSYYIKYLLTNSAYRRSDIIYPNPDWGYGLIE